MSFTIQSSAFNEHEKSPFNELNKPPDILEEAEVLIVGSTDPVLRTAGDSPYNASPVSPSACAAEVLSLDWDAIPGHAPWDGGVYSEHLSGSLPQDDWYRNGHEPFENGGQGVAANSRIFPDHPNPSTILAYQYFWAQYSCWGYTPSDYNSPPSLDHYWRNQMYTQRARFRINRKVDVWWAEAFLFSCEYTGPAGPPFAESDFTEVALDSTHPEVLNLKLHSPAYIDSKTLPPYEWFEVPFPALNSASFAVGRIGKITFAVYDETPADWSARTGFSL